MNRQAPRLVRNLRAPTSLVGTAIPPVPPQRPQLPLAPVFVQFSACASRSNEPQPLSPDPNKANLGLMVEELRQRVPQMLQQALPQSLVSKDVLLRICPTHFDHLNAYLPNIKGHVAYYTTLKTLQMVFTSIVLNPKVKLHVQAIKIRPASELAAPFHCVYPDSTKLYVRWTTCGEECAHLTRDSDVEAEADQKFHSTADARLGSHRWTKVDMNKLTQLNTGSPGGSLSSVGRTISHLTTGLIGLAKSESKLERVISGLFIFELNSDHSKIIVHTVENVDIVERTEPEEVGGLRVC